jgi:UDP-N-acetylglucosamine transferase subunit ALG13
MIFASVGSVLPFDRLVRAVDDWAAENPAHEVFLQIGQGEYEPRHVPWVRLMTHEEYRRRLQDCSLFVAHVGIGSILQALEERKQMLALARHRSLGEHTTDHQLHTASRFNNVAGLRIVEDASALQSAMSLLVGRPMTPADGIATHASKQLLDNIASFLRPVRERKRGLALARR